MPNPLVAFAGDMELVPWSQGLANALVRRNHLICMLLPRAQTQEMSTPLLFFFIAPHLTLDAGCPHPGPTLIAPALL